MFVLDLEKSAVEHEKSITNYWFGLDYGWM